ncbi:MAG: SMC-Scp complex subunit ScpB [Cyanobacteria bacterium P01_F01_bin.53]
MPRLASTIEAILYLKAQPLKIAQIAEFAKCDKETAEEGLIELMGEYAHREGALEITETEEGYALQLRELFKPLVNSIVPLDIGLGALRTLAAIALRGPIAQNELVELRGSGVYQHVPDLVEQGFVKKRRQSDGRSSWLQITEKFYQHFEIDKLPQISNLQLPKPIAGSSNAAEGDTTEEAPTAGDTTGNENIKDTDQPKNGEVTASNTTTRKPKPDTNTSSTEVTEAADLPQSDANPEENAGNETSPNTATPEATDDNDSPVVTNQAPDLDPNIAEEIAILSGSKLPSAENAPLSDAALEAVKQEITRPAPVETAKPEPIEPETTDTKTPSADSE